MITITKDKIYRSPYSLKKTEADSTKVEILESSDIVGFMDENVEFGEDLTFGDLFELIIFNKGFFNVLFNSSMGGYMVDDFILDYETKIKEEPGEEEYVVRLVWVCDIYEFNQKVEYYDYVAFEGFGKLTKKDKEQYPIGIAFTNLNTLKDKKIVISNEFEINSASEYDKETDLKPILKANYRPITLYQVIHSILSEISFYGNPEQRDNYRKDLERESREIDRWISDEGRVSENFIEFEDFEGFDDEVEMIIGEFDVEDETTFWDVLYPDSDYKKENKEDIKESVDNAIIAISEGSGLSLEEQMLEAQEEEDYEKAAKIKKLIEKRDKK